METSLKTELDATSYMLGNLDWTSQKLDENTLAVVWLFNDKLYYGEFLIDSVDKGLFIRATLDLGKESLYGLYSRNAKNRYQLCWTCDYMAKSMMDDLFRQVVSLWVALYS